MCCVYPLQILSSVVRNALHVLLVEVESMVTQELERGRLNHVLLTAQQHDVEGLHGVRAAAMLLCILGVGGAHKLKARQPQ